MNAVGARLRSIIFIEQFIGVIVTRSVHMHVYSLFFQSMCCCLHEIQKQKIRESRIQKPENMRKME